MSLVYVGELPLPLLCPQLNLCIGLPSIQFSADLNASLALTASLSISPPTVAIYLADLLEIEAQLAFSIEFSLPTVQFTLDISLSIEVSLQLSLSLLLNFELGLSLSLFLSASIGVYAFSWEGPGNTLGAALTTELASQWPDGAPTSGACNAIVFGAVSSSAIINLPAFLNGLNFGPGLVVQAKLGALAALTPLTSKAETQASAAISAKASAQAKVSAALGAQVSIPTPSATVKALANFQANLEASLSLAPPKISAAIAASASISANIQLTAGFMASFGAVFGNFGAELFCYTYSGTGNQLGAAVTTALTSTWGDMHTPTTGECTAVVLATTDSFSASVVGAFFGGL